MDLSGDKTLLSKEDVMIILARMENGEEISDIFDPETSPWPSFAFHEFRQHLKKDPQLRSIYESVQTLSAHRARKELRELGKDRAPSKDDVPAYRLQYDIKKHLEQNRDPDLDVISVDDSGIAQAAVVLLPRKAPKGLAAQLLGGQLPEGEPVAVSTDDE